MAPLLCLASTTAAASSSTALLQMADPMLPVSVEYLKISTLYGT